MEFLRELMREEGIKKLFATAILFGLLYSMKSLFDLLLLTFIFTFLFSNMQRFIWKHIHKVFPIKGELVTIFLYLFVTAGLMIALVKYIPLLLKQLTAIGAQVTSFSFKEYSETLDPRLFALIQEINIEEYIHMAEEAIMGLITNTGEFGMYVILAFLFSLFFNLEKGRIAKLCQKLENSKVAYFYTYYAFIGKKFINSFGKVLQVQILIAFINAILSVVILAFIGFTQYVGLGFMIFVLGLIPVAGVVISFIPLSIIAFTMGGISKVVAVIVMILLLHGLESYFLNPKLMSVRTKLPIFFTFLALVIGEHFFGMWGLLMGLPLFMFLLDVAGVKLDEKN
ncbi:AI-2E family transporter [Peptococcaceae bacterium 1198_IL3148]